MKITIIGAGNVGTHLGKRLFEKGHEIVEVFSRVPAKAELLANQVGARAVSALSELGETADIYILAVKDDAIEAVAAAISVDNPFIVHTSGATPSTVLSAHSSQYGIFYPLQTFSIDKSADFEKLPMCVYANNSTVLKKLKNLAQSICPNVYEINDKERAILHVCAVFVNNFTNHLFAVAEDILTKENLTLHLLKPLIQETVNKIQQHPAKAMQTGPAFRGDVQTVERHLDFLEQYPDYQLIYRVLSESIGR